jgi:hypothetical protein
MHSTRSKRLKHETKFCYIGHRLYLPVNHLWRRNKRTFNGNQEFEYAPNVPSGDDILMQLERMIFRDENVGKKSTPTEKSKKDSKKKQNKRKKTPKKQKQVTDEKCVEKEKYFL